MREENFPRQESTIHEYHEHAHPVDNGIGCRGEGEKTKWTENQIRGDVEISTLPLFHSGVQSSFPYEVVKRICKWLS